MECLRNTCIVHRIEEAALSTYYKNFVRWIGIFHLDFTVNEENEEMNQFIEYGKNQFDFMVYLNDKSNKWLNQYSSYSDTNVSIEYLQEDGWDMNQFGGKFLTQIWKEIFAQKQGEDWKEIEKVIQSLIYIYEKKRVFTLLVDDYNVLRPSYKKKYLTMKFHQWESVIKELKKCCKEYGSYRGLEYLQYALIYSHQKTNDICTILRTNGVLDTKRMLKASQYIYESDSEFYIVEYLKARNVQDDFMKSRTAEYYIKNCIDKCNNDVIKSFLYYCLGRAYEREGAMDIAWKNYEMSYKKNKNNFRALYKLAVLYKKNGRYNKAKASFKRILQILQIRDLGNRENLKYLDLLELEYACKCYILIGDLENPVNAVLYYQEVTEISKRLEENTILKNVYLDGEENEKYKILENNFNINYIKDKIAHSQKSRQYKRWEKVYEKRS